MIALILILLDFLAVLASYQLSYLIRTSVLPAIITFPEPQPWYLFNPIWLPLVFMFFFWFEGLYSKRLTLWDEVRHIWKGLFLASLSIFAIVSLGRLVSSTSRTVLLLTFFNLLWILPLLRMLGKKIMFLSSLFRRKVLILGAGLTGEVVQKTLSKEKNMGYEVVGYLDDDARKIKKNIINVKVLGKISEVDKYLVKGMEVILAIPGMKAEKLVRLVNHMQKKVVKVSFIPDLFGIPFFEGDMDFFFENHLLVLNIRNNLKNWGNKILKKIFDIVLSVPLFLVLLPVIIILAALVKFGSKGSVFYVTDRIGKDGSLFKFYKFRTMYIGGDEILKKVLSHSKSKKKEWDTYFKLKDDPRVTGFGKFLRKYSLDELPQILNIIKGDMSLIGPRPYLPRESNAIGDYADVITQVAPGVTGLWQVSGRNKMTFKERLVMDSWYIQNWSLWLDVVILIKTVKAVFKREGAY